MEFTLHAPTLSGDFFDNAAGIAETGIPSVQIDLSSLGLSSANALVPNSLVQYARDTAERHQVEIKSLRIDADPLSLPDDTFGELLGQVPALVSLAERLGIPLLVLDGPRTTDALPGREDLIARLKELMGALSSSTVQAAILPLRAGESAGSVQTRRLLDQVADQRLSVILDPSALAAERNTDNLDIELSKELDWLAEALGGVYIRDTADFSMNWRYCLRRLGEMNFQGPVVLRQFDDPLPDLLRKLNA